ncbi:MAG: S8 family serine peptidase [Verrucomicrobiae bacterium]|nr:S8 family serine peptidase [Verrucomicrobiae bacterium]
MNTNQTSIDEGGRLIKNLDFLGNYTRITADPVGVPPFTTHATRVTDIAASSHGTFTGVAPASHVYVGAVDTDPGIFNAMDWLYRGHGVAQFNMSLGAGDNDGGANKLALALDYHMHTYDTLMIKSAGNSGGQVTSPGDFYNGITVGALNETFTARASFSSYLMQGESGTTVNFWPKPEVVAPGVNINTQFLGPASGTSYAAPHVSGIVALLQKGTSSTPGLTLGTAGNANHLAIKAIIMNSARKREIEGPINSYPIAADLNTTASQASDGDYLNGSTFRVGVSATAPKTAEWTPSKWSYTNNVFVTDAPLDDELGTGAVDALRAVLQLDGGQQGPGAVNPIGWDLNTLNMGSPKDYYLNFPTGGTGVFLTVTLTWDRRVSRTEGGEPDLEFQGDSFTPLALPNLDLQIFYQGSLYAQSVGTYNTEHLHIPLIHAGAANSYMVRVQPVSNVSNTRYALAWWGVSNLGNNVVPEPTMVALLVLGGAILGRRFWQRK